MIPQIIARIHTPVQPVRRLILELLTSIGKEHPQALVYPLTVASKSQSSARLAAARSIMDKMRKHSANLVDQALMVSQELLRYFSLSFNTALNPIPYSLALLPLFPLLTFF